MTHLVRGKAGLARLLGKDLAAAVSRAAPAGCKSIPAWLDLRDRAPATILGPGDALYVFSWSLGQYGAPAHQEAYENKAASDAGFTASRLVGLAPKPGQVLLVAHAQDGGNPRRWTATLVFCAGDAPELAAQDLPVRGI